MQELHGTVPAPAPVQLFPCELPAYRDPAPDAAQLNADITAAEVERALRRAKRGKAAGHDGLSADLLKDAAPALLDKYVDLFSLMLAGDIPDALSMGIITAVHKTGDKCDMANYRSITVTPPLKKVFDSVLECRLTAWTEEHGLRAASQAGFRPDQRTTMSSILCRTSTAVKGDSSTAVLWISAKPSTLCHGMCCGQCSVALVLGAASCPACRPCTAKTVQQSRQLMASASPSDAIKGCSREVH